MYLDNGASRSTLRACASSSTSAAVNVLVMLSIGIIDRTCTRAPTPSVPAAPAQDPRSVTTAAASPLAPAAPDAACSTTASSRTAWSFFWVDCGKGLSMGSGNGAYDVAAVMVVVRGEPPTLPASLDEPLQATSSTAATRQAPPDSHADRIVMAPPGFAQPSTSSQNAPHGQACHCPSELAHSPKARRWALTRTAA